MPRARLSTVNSRKLATLFLAVVVPPAITLVWLGMRLLEQDRSLLAQRELESRQAAAQTIVRSLDQLLNEAERRAINGPVPEGALRLVISDSGIKAEPAGRLLWFPGPRRFREAATAPFSEAEALEFQGNPQRALSRYEESAGSPDVLVRAGALLRLARVRRRAGQWNDALEAYRRLALLKGVAINDTPAGLVARSAICSLLDESRDKAGLAREAAALESDFLGGQWILDKAAWELTVANLEHWTARDVTLAPERRQASVLADALWEEWEQVADHTIPVRPRVMVVEKTPITLLSQRSGPSLVTLALFPQVAQEWLTRAGRATQVADAQVRLVTDSGETITGSTVPITAGAVKIYSAETGLPWTVVLTAGELASEPFAQRRRLLAAGLAAIMLLLAGGSYILWRVVQRELVVARQQTDFVSAVSHEFRTPLAALRHITELLAEDDDLPRERLRGFYQALGRSTERLHRLVESLLDFARMESGRKAYHLRPMDAAELAEQVVADFEKEVESRGISIELDVERGLGLHADTASLTHALWNLLDNAVKYSPHSDTILVSVRRRANGIAISVHDHGLGIPDRERKEIFRRFVRGEKARELGISGTGLGLAIVSHVAEAHGGTVEVESEEGTGSTFHLVLPAAT